MLWICEYLELVTYKYFEFVAYDYLELVTNDGVVIDNVTNHVEQLDDLREQYLWFMSVWKSIE